MVLLVVASNVATLVFARTWARAPELSVRTALGAARSASSASCSWRRCCSAQSLRSSGWLVRMGRFAGSRARSRVGPTTSPSAESTHRAVRRRPDAAGQRGKRTATGAARDQARSAQHALRRPRLRFGGFGKVGALLLVVEIALSVALLNGAVTMARAFNAYFDEFPRCRRTRF